MSYLDSFIKHPPAFINKKINELIPLSYNRFYWWKLFKEKNTPLVGKYSLIDKIKNGDYDFSSYLWQAQYTILKAIDKIKDIKDYNIQVEKTSIDLERYRKLMVDFEKEEQKRLHELKHKFTKEFFIEYNQVENEMLNFNGTMEEFYYFILKKYNQKKKTKIKVIK